jgi:CRISPR-associated protein Csb2
VTEDRFAIIAEFPLGTYRGHVGDGDLDEFPSVARLHAALLCAAATGPMACLTDNGLGPSEPAMTALQWLESNPPDALFLPRLERNQNPGIVAYRDLGLLSVEDAPESVDTKVSSQGASKQTSKVQKSKVWRSRTLARPANDSVALAGTIAWIWDTPPPDDVRLTLENLCPDVSHLGCAESPVRLRVGQSDATHRRDDCADLFSRSGIDVLCPTTGRTTELMEIEHARRSDSSSESGDESLSEGTRQRNRGRPSARPSDPDRVNPPENEQRLPGEHRCVTRARFNTTKPSARKAPWSWALLVPLDAEIPADFRVLWAVTAHRALIRLIGSGAPALLTGHYPERAARPANRVAIHFLDTDVLDKDLVARYASHDSVHALLAVMIPSGATTTDIECIARATERLKYLVGPGGDRVVRVRDAKIVEVGAQEFWPPVPPRHTRLWRTVPAAIPDTRPPCRGSWTLEDAIALSVGLVFRDQLGADSRVGNWRVQLATAAKNKGVRAKSVRMVTTGDPTRFVHHVNPGVVVRPYEAVVDLGDLGAPQGLLAIGQSRHLGGGLLYPTDIPDEGLVSS